MLFVLMHGFFHRGERRGGNRRKANCSTANKAHEYPPHICSPFIPGHPATSTNQSRDTDSQSGTGSSLIHAANQCHHACAARNRLAIIHVGNSATRTTACPIAHGSQHSAGCAHLATNQTTRVQSLLVREIRIRSARNPNMAMTIASQVCRPHDT